MASESEVESPDFSQPWKLSDVVLVVEEERFHVYRAMLAFWSPVFEKMFTSEFQEKDKNEIPLPGKIASEIKEILSLIYPSVKVRPITEENCCFLVKLAHEYQMEAIVTRCEDIMVDNVNRGKSKVKPQKSVVENLVFAQTYDLELAKCLYEHVSCKLNYSYFDRTDTDSYLAAVSKDESDRHFCKCSKCNGGRICLGLSAASSHLSSIKYLLEKNLTSTSI